MIRSLLTAGAVEPGKVCALFDSEEGTSELVDLSEEFHRTRRAQGHDAGQSTIQSICSSRIYDDLFKEVRLLVRASQMETKEQLSAEIQSRMDEEYNYAVAKNDHLAEGLKVGDAVRIVKDGSNNLANAVVIETNWQDSGRVKVALERTGVVKSYLPQELEWRVPEDSKDRLQEEMWEEEHAMLMQGKVEIGVLFQRLMEKKTDYEKLGTQIEQLREHLSGRVPASERRHIMKHLE
jgi:hypothetical protein